MTDSYKKYLSSSEYRRYKELQAKYNIGTNKEHNSVMSSKDYKEGHKLSMKVQKAEFKERFSVNGAKF